MKGKCEACNAYRTRLHQCVICHKRLCGGDSFGSRAGRVCLIGPCHRTALDAHVSALLTFNWPTATPTPHQTEV